MTKFERMTERDKFGNVEIIGVDSADLFENLNREQVLKIDTALNRLAELEDGIENGTVLILPCKVGDTVYEINLDCTKISEMTARSLWDIIRWKEDEVFGRWLFNTKAEAEAKLKKLQLSTKN